MNIRTARFAALAVPLILLLAAHMCAQPLAIHTSSNIPTIGPSGTEAISSRTFVGKMPQDLFGQSVASAGDVNGDGFDDLVVGSDGKDAGGSNVGRAYIFFGGRVIDNTADVILTGAAPEEKFGCSVASAGDVNGDGYADVIVGAWGNDSGGSDAGRAYIFFGGPAMDPSADVILTGAVAGDHFGWSCASAGDVNADGYADVIVGAYLNDAGGSSAGRTYIYFGGPAMDNVADVTLTGAPTDNFGYSVAAAGDANGDGYADVIVGALLNDAGGTNAGRAYIYFGGSAMDNIADVTLTGAALDDRFGNSVASAGDVNCDGYSDMIVGAYYNDAGGSAAGRVYIYFGGSTMNNVADVTLTGLTAGDHFGDAVASAGDLNGDGYADVIVGASRNDAGGSGAGRAYVYFGGAAMDTTFDVVFTGAAASDYLGYCVSCAGDVDGDGLPDLALGASGNDAAGANAGCVYLYLNAMIGSDLPDEFFSGAATTDFFGESVAGAGDVNGDGYPDVIVGADHNDAGGADAGRAYIYYGGPRTDNKADVTLTGLTHDLFGSSVAGAGDVNGDGYEDVIVGAPNRSEVAAYAGAAYIFYGGASMDSVADITFLGAAEGNNFGIAVAGAGDVNGDGYADVIVGERFADGGAAGSGKAYIYFGGASMNTAADAVLPGEATSDDFGHSLAGAGDVNGDGFADVIVGASGNDAGGTDAGAAYVFLGGAIMDTVADVVLTGQAASDGVGRSVAGAGDLNGDGYADLVVGAYKNDAAPFIAGAAYVYFGGLSLDDVPDVMLRGKAAEDIFGFSVGRAGDVNGDGYADVVVGAMNADEGGPDFGSAYVYFGGHSMNSTPDIVMMGKESDSNFGYAVACAGDVNRDGLSDIIVGASGDFSVLGHAYLYISSAPRIVPGITAVRDVPFDQGGRVTVRWARSGYDSRDVNKVTSYWIARSRPPGISGFAWENVTTVEADQRSLYEYSVETPNDSMAGFNGTYYFQVTARTSSSAEFWRSNIVSGHSVDNLAPDGVLGLSGSLETSSSIRLRWPANTGEEDLSGYSLYRSTTPGFTPGEANRLASLTDTSYLDSSLPTAPILYYRVCARDIHGNVGAPSPQAAVPLASTQSYSVTSAWNMISVPLQVSDYRTTVLYPTAITQAFAFKGAYVAKDTLVNGRGYWLKFPSAQSVPLTGFGIASDTVDVTEGWNMIGSISVTVPVVEVTSIPAAMIISPFYGYADGYAVAPIIEPHKGYWVKVGENGKLILTVSGGGSAAVHIGEPAELPPDPPFLTGVAEGQIPTTFGLEQNYPNPFNPGTSIGFGVSGLGSMWVRLAVYDLLGREVAVLVDEMKEPGRYQVTFDGSALASGVYLYRMTAGEFVESRRMMILK
jgi:hypothetical protein